ncbi:UNVERIFIED_CONTAM: putative protein ORF91 [Sesamum indicum]
MKIDGECLIELIRSCRNKVQVYRSVRMPQLHTSLHFHLTPIVMINGSSRRDLLLNSQNFCRSIPAGAENPSLSRLCYRKLWGSRNRRALILGWAYYLDAFSSYPLRTWLPSVYRGHDNWYTRGKGPLNALTPTPDMDRTVSRRSEPSSRTALMGEQPNPWNILQPQVAKSRHRGAKPSRRCRLSSLLDGWVLAVKLPSAFALEGQSPSGPRKPLHASVTFWEAYAHRNCLPETVPWPWYLTDGSGPPRKEAFFAFHLSCAGKAQTQSQGTVVRIFTDMSISPSLLSETVPRSLRLSCGSELTDKEFRYLRTVIVTAPFTGASVAGSPVIRSPTSLTFRHWAGVSPHTWSYDFAETCVFGKQSPGAWSLRPPLVPFCLKVVRAFPGSMAWVTSAPVAPGARTLARGIFSTPSYPEKAGAPYVLEPITIFRLT